MISGLNFYIIGSAAVFVLLILLGFIVSSFYRRAQKDTSYVRTGFGGEKIIINGGAFVLPVLHEVQPINMKTLRIEIIRDKERALVTADPLRVDVIAEFFLRVATEEKMISTAARALGDSTMDEEKIKVLFEAPCVAALRSVASKMELEELHQKRQDFEHNVEEAVNVEFRKNGLELVSVSLTRLDQTDKQFFDASNSFDAKGLTILEKTISENEKSRNTIQREKEVAILQKDLETTIKKEQQELEEAKASNERKLKKSADEAETQRRIEEINIEKELDIERAQQDMNIKQAVMEREVSQAWIETNKIKAEFEKISEEIRTAREKAEAERARIVEVISAEKEAQRQNIIAEANASSEKMAAEAAKIRYEIEAAGKKALNEASNLLSNEQISMQVKMEIVKQLPSIITESVRPIENIDGIKIMHVDGLNNAVGRAGGGGEGGSGANSSLADQVVDSALRYRAQVPLIESLLGEVGLKGGSINDLTQGLQQEISSKNVSDATVEAGSAETVNPSPSKDSGVADKGKD